MLTADLLSEALSFKYWKKGLSGLQVQVKLKIKEEVAVSFWLPYTISKMSVLKHHKVLTNQLCTVQRKTEEYQKRKTSQEERMRPQLEGIQLGQCWWSGTLKMKEKNLK